MISAHVLACSLGPAKGLTTILLQVDSSQLMGTPRQACSNSQNVQKPPAPTGTAARVTQAADVSRGGGQGEEGDPLEDWGDVEVVLWGLRRGTRDEQGWGEAAVGWQAERSPGGEGKPRLMHLIDLLSERSLSCRQTENWGIFLRDKVAAADQSVPNLVTEAWDHRVKS